MPGDNAVRRREHFARNHLAWIVVRHFLSADLLEELCQAVVLEASCGMLGLVDLFETSRSGGPPALASWVIRPRPREAAFDHFLQDVIRHIVWQGDQTVGYLGQELEPDVVATMKSLEDALRVSSLDLGSAASAAGIFERAPRSLKTVLYPIIELGRHAGQPEQGTLEPLIKSCVEIFGCPLGAIVVKHLGDLCIDMDHSTAASTLYDRAKELLDAPADLEWSDLIVAFGTMINQSCASARRNLEGPDAAIDILDGLAVGVNLGTQPLALLNSIPDAMDANWTKRAYHRADDRASIAFAPQLLDSLDLALAYDHWIARKYSEAHRWFWATLRRQIALGSVTYSRHTKAAFGRSLIDAAREETTQPGGAERFRLGVRLLVEGGRPEAVEMTSWTEQLIHNYVDDECIEATLACSRNAPGVVHGRTLVTVALFKHWIQALPPADDANAGRMLSAITAVAREQDNSSPFTNELADAAFESLTSVAGIRPEFRPLVAADVAEMVSDRLTDSGTVTITKALELAIAVLDVLDERSLFRLGYATVQLLENLKPSTAPWPIVRPAMALLRSEQTLSLCERDTILRAQVPKVLLEYALDSETEHSSLMFLLRDLRPDWIQPQMDTSRVQGVVSELRRRIAQVNSSRAADDIVALLVAPAFSGAAGIRDAMAALHKILASALAGEPAISFARAYRAVMLVGDKRQSLPIEAVMPVEEFTLDLEAVFSRLLELWKKAAQAPSIFAGFSIPPRTAPNPAIVHNWTFASVGLARSLGKEQEMVDVLDLAAREPVLEGPISVARAIRVADEDTNLFDVEAIHGEKREAFYSALGQRLMLLGSLPETTRSLVIDALLQQSFRLGPRGMDAGIFVAASNSHLAPIGRFQDAATYRRRLENDPELRINLGPMFDRLNR